MNVAALISGGVDSAVAACLLCRQGLKPDLFYIRIGMDGADYSCAIEEDVELCRATARRLGLNFQIIDLQKEYWELVGTYLLDKVKSGLTPNPDVMCNKLIKFGCFQDRVGRFYDKTATGHYARIVERGGLPCLGTAKDPVKDQTDFLAQIDVPLNKLLFPIGGLMKREVRAIALQEKLPSALRRDSQGICFLGKVNYNDFLRRFLGECAGDIVEVETGRVIGRHRGYWFHTIGQRKGLFLSGGPWYVVRKDVSRNIIFVSRGFNTEKQYGKSFFLRDFHALCPVPFGEISFKIRHTDTFMRGLLSRAASSLLKVESQTPVQGIAPGQFGVIYDAEAEICVGSGEICMG